jgi:hypothetical protein
METAAAMFILGRGAAGHAQQQPAAGEFERHGVNRGCNAKNRLVSLLSRSFFPILVPMHPLIARGIFFSAVTFAAAPSSAAATPDRWIPLFNGKDLTGWVAPSPNTQWRIERGVLIGESDEKLTGGMLWTDRKFGDFVFETDVRWDGNPDSGIFMRTPALQVQIGTSISQKRDLTGSFYIPKTGYPEALQAKDAAKHLKRGDWNTLRIEARGETFKVSINGHPVSQYTDARYGGPGPIGVQIHPKLKMKVEFRNIRVAELR